MLTLKKINKILDEFTELYSSKIDIEKYVINNKLLNRKVLRFRCVFPNMRALTMSYYFDKENKEKDSLDITLYLDKMHSINLLSFQKKTLRTTQLQYRIIYNFENRNIQGDSKIFSGSKIIYRDNCFKSPYCIYNEEHFRQIAYATTCLFSHCEMAGIFKKYDIKYSSDTSLILKDKISIDVFTSIKGKTYDDEKYFYKIIEEANKGF